jgi:hypothetical protein
MNSDKFVYVIYIASTPQKVWDAPLDGENDAVIWGPRKRVRLEARLKMATSPIRCNTHSFSRRRSDRMQPTRRW